MDSRRTRSVWPHRRLAGIVIKANGQTLPWVRDSVDMFKMYVHVPEGVTELHVHDDFLATAAPVGFSSGASTSENLAMISWNEVMLWPQAKSAKDVLVTPTVILPEGWKFATALTSTGNEGATTHFATVPLNQLVDSPVLSGRYFREIPLAPEISPKHYLDLAADGPEDLDVPPQMLAGFNDLVRQADALYKSHHYGSYHFLMTLSDQVAHFGLEHHQSNDDRVPEKTFLDPKMDELEAGLLPHEFTHSWNGKYRRPAGLLSPDFQTPMKGDLLWVYEGLTEYLGDVLTARSGLWTDDQYREALANSAAGLDNRPGRTWRDLQDTATAAQIFMKPLAAVGQLASQCRLLSGRRTALASSGHHHSPAKPRQEIAERFLCSLSRSRRQYRTYHRAVYVSGCGEQSECGSAV